MDIIRRKKKGSRMIAPRLGGKCDGTILARRDGLDVSSGTIGCSQNDLLLGSEIDWLLRAGNFGRRGKRKKSLIPL
jgi:hypothetical protein